MASCPSIALDATFNQIRNDFISYHDDSKNTLTVSFVFGSLRFG